MQTIGFTSSTADGVIKIPQEYMSCLGQEVLVILVVNDGVTQKTPESRKRQLTALQIDTKDIVFDRDEANER